MKTIVLLFLLCFSVVGHASESLHLPDLNLDGSCKTKSQEKMAETVLHWFDAFKREDLNEQIALFSKDFRLYHTALTRFVLLNPKVAPFLKWGIGPLSQSNYRATLAQLMDGEDQSQQGDLPVSLSCGEPGNENVIVVTVDFKGYKTKRDPSTGCITHRVGYKGIATKTFVVDPKTYKIRMNFVDFDGRLADEARAQLANFPVSEIDKATCRTAAETNKLYGVRP